jgi:lysophospholipase L1-like esterase
VSERRRKVLFALVAVLLFLGLAEAGLRLAGFSYQPVPEQIWLGRLQGGVPTGEVVFDRMVPGLFTRDALLFWRPVAGREPFNAAGLRDSRELPDAKPAGEVRLLALGDSCTFLGEPLPWTDLLEDRLRRAGRHQVRVLNAAVPAWSSLQGLRYLESRGLDLEPDVVLIYFGWNDHWRATVKPDAEFPIQGEEVVAVQRALSRSRLYQLLNDLLKGAWRSPRLPEGGGAPFDDTADLSALATQRPFRVPLPSFEENLGRLARLARERGARPVFITAPSRLAAGSVPQYLFAHGFVARGGPPVQEIHDSYAAAVRRLARESGALLVDAASHFAAARDGGRDWIRDDGIHLTAEGINEMAGLVARELEKEWEERESP